jgi:hypothetical protein
LSAAANLSPISLNGKSSSGLPVAYALVSGKATLDGNLLRPTAPGLVVIRAIQPGDDTFSAAEPVEQAFRFGVGLNFPPVAVRLRNP